MGCILACFRIKDDGKRKAHPISRWIPFKRKGSLVSKKRPAPLPICEDPCDADRLSKELMHKAKLLKRCGAVLEPPAEIQKQFEIKIGRTLDDDDQSSNSHSWFPCTSSKKLLEDEQHDNLHEDSSFPEINSAGHNSGGNQALVHYDNDLSSVTSSKSTHFDGGKRYSGVEAGSDFVTLDSFPHQTDSQIKPSGSSRSPYPTPLKLTDEMQTPLTVYPSNLENIRTRMNARVRAQYVYQVLDPAEKIPRERSCWPDRSTTNFEPQTPCGRDNSRLSSPSNKRGQTSKRVHKEKYVSGRSPSSVAPTLNGREKAFLSPENPQLVDEREGNNTETVTKEIFNFKGLDGNGIPNTTSKYKEDQKVQWHTTPFEERLKKVLSDDKLFPQRELIKGEPIELENEEQC